MFLVFNVLFFKRNIFLGLALIIFCSVSSGRSSSSSSSSASVSVHSLALEDEIDFFNVG
jgi:hypothetical protein